MLQDVAALCRLGVFLRQTSAVREWCIGEVDMNRRLPIRQISVNLPLQTVLSTILY